MNTIKLISFVLVAGLSAASLAGCTAEQADVTDVDSSESEVVAAEKTFTGEFASIMAIGGETTGTWLDLDGNAKPVELDLKTNKLLSKFAPGLRVTVKGKFKTVLGVEIRSRKVLVVTSVKQLSTGGQVTKAGASVLTADATKIVVENHGGGFRPPPPAGSTCSIGAGKYTLTLASKKLEWTSCESPDFTTPSKEVAGSRTLSATEFTNVKKDLAKIKVFKGDICGADKPFETVTVTSPAGSFEYIDSFYSCQADKVAVDGIDEARNALRELADVVLPQRDPCHGFKCPGTQTCIAPADAPVCVN